MYMSAYHSSRKAIHAEWRPIIARITGKRHSTSQWQYVMTVTVDMVANRYCNVSAPVLFRVVASGERGLQKCQSTSFKI